MKKTVLTMLAVLVFVPAQAQLFTEESVGGAALGGLIGGIIGHNSGRRTAEGIGIGAGAGFLLGALAHQSRRDRYYRAPGYYRYDYYGYGAPAYYYAAPRYYRVPAYVAPIYVASTPSAVPATQVIARNHAATTQRRMAAASPVSAPASPMSGANALFGR
jgi:hypothetical protein